MHEVASSTVIINVLVQIVNIAIFFGIFYYFLAAPLAEAIEKRKKILEQFKNADEILQKKLKEAEEEKVRIIQEGVEHKNKLIMQAKEEAEQIKASILEQAERERKNLLEKAEIELKSQKEELEKEWENSVKKAVFAIYEKLLNDKNTAVLEKYIENIKNYK